MQARHTQQQHDYAEQDRLVELRRGLLREELEQLNGQIQSCHRRCLVGRASEWCHREVEYASIDVALA